MYFRQQNILYVLQCTNYHGFKYSIFFPEQNTLEYYMKKLIGEKVRRNQIRLHYSYL